MSVEHQHQNGFVGGSCCVGAEGLLEAVCILHTPIPITLEHTLTPIIQLIIGQWVCGEEGELGPLLIPSPRLYETSQLCKLASNLDWIVFTRREESLSHCVYVVGGLPEHYKLHCRLGNCLQEGVVVEV